VEFATLAISLILSPFIHRGWCTFNASYLLLLI